MDKILTIMLSTAGIIAIAILINNLGIDGVNIPQADVPAADQPAVPVDSSCIDGYNIKADEVVFVHSTSCPHCRSMMPIVEKLEKEGYEFYWAEGSDIEARKAISACFSDVLGGYVPQFICAGTKQEQTGAMTENQLKSFADSCKNN